MDRILTYALYSLHSSVNQISSQERNTQIGNFEEYLNKIPEIDRDRHHIKYERRTGRIWQA